MVAGAPKALRSIVNCVISAGWNCGMSILVKVLIGNAQAPIIIKMPKTRGRYPDLMMSRPNENI